MFSDFLKYFTQLCFYEIYSSMLEFSKPKLFRIYVFKPMIAQLGNVVLETSSASATSLASTASKCNFLKKFPDPDGLIIIGTKITNTGHFFVE